MKVNKRAYSSGQKRVIMERILAQWNRYDDMRLTQLISNAADHHDIFYVEDYDLAKLVEEYGERCDLKVTLDAD